MKEPTDISTTCPTAIADLPLPTDERAADELLARLAKALGHPIRIAILRRLARVEGCYVGQIVEELPLAQSTVSQHLKQLRDAGLIRGEIEGPRVCYCIEPAVLAQFKALVDTL